jgi:hypothetical protein
MIRIHERLIRDSLFFRGSIGITMYYGRFNFIQYKKLSKEVEKLIDYSLVPIKDVLLNEIEEYIWMKNLEDRW